MGQSPMLDALNYYRDEPSPSITIQLPVNPLADGTHCHSVDTQLHAGDIEWERAKATPSLWKSLPRNPGLYMFVWRPEFSFRLANPTGTEHRPAHVIYIGQAGGGTSKNDLRTRYKQEYAQYVGGDPRILWRELDRPNRAERLRKYLTLTPLEYWHVSLTDRMEIKRLEGHLNRMFRPFINQVGLARVAEPVDAFTQPRKS